MGDIQWTTEKRRLCDLVAWERNPRQIKKAEAERLIDSLEQFGQIQTIAIGPDNQIYDGHQRKLVWAASQKFGADYEVDVRVSSRALSERERQQLVVYLHKGTVGEWDWDVLANEFELGDLKDWGFTDFDFQLAGWDMDEEPPPDPGPQIDRAAELQEQWGTRLGQCWELGDHRLVCGDCIDGAIDIVMVQGERVDSIVTDPPYGVDYGGGTTQREKLEGDKSPALYFPFLKRAHDYCRTSAALYLFYADGDAAVTQAVTQAGYSVRNTLIWNKNQAQFGALSAQYKQKHEPLLYCYMSGHSPQWFGPTNEVTVWDVARASVNEMHPTQKPVELIERALKNSTKGGDLVLDGFLGSGTTLIACERLGRRCRAIEIDPAYIAVTLQRWHDMTGRDPVLVSE